MKKFNLLENDECIIEKRRSNLITINLKTDNKFLSENDD